MPPSRPVVWLDLVDPLSWALEHELRALEEDGIPTPPRGSLELRPPPAPLLDPGSGPWRERRERAGELARSWGVELAEPHLVPWSRKAHELLLHAREVERETEVRAALFRTFHLEGRDVGRVDVLVELAAGLGMDRTRTKAVLDVDRHAAAVAQSHQEALDAGAVSPPALWTGERLAQGFHDRDALRTLLIP